MATARNKIRRNGTSPLLLYLSPLAFSNVFLDSKGILKKTICFFIHISVSFPSPFGVSKLASGVSSVEESKRFKVSANQSTDPQ